MFEKTYSKVHNTAEIISKALVTLSLVNSNKSFDFVNRVIKTKRLVKTPCLFYFHFVKFHSVEETHMMLVTFWHWDFFFSHLSTKDSEGNLCQGLLTIEITD